jgi:hypothetical protein
MRKLLGIQRYSLKLPPFSGIFDLSSGMIGKYNV